MCCYDNGKVYVRNMCSIHYFILFSLLEMCAVSRAGIFSEKNIYIPSFNYRRCDPEVKNERFTFWFEDFDIMATAYGDIDITGKFTTMYNLTSPLKVTTILKRKFLGINFKIPCIKNFGSCTYKDVCAYGYSENECPPILDEYDVPCSCPVVRGTYHVPGIQLKGMAKSKWAPLLTGKYSGTIKVYQGKSIVSCYHVKFTLA